MDKKVYTVTLADGAILTELILNGNNFISTVEINPDIFDCNCSPVIISDGTNEIEHANMELVQFTITATESWFILRDISNGELAQIKLQSDLEYIAMMSGIDL